MRIKKLLGFHKFLVLIIITSCRFNSESINQEEDRQEAEVITARLYENIKAKNYEATWELYSKDFFKVASKEQLTKIYIKTHQKLGNLKEINLATWKTRRVEGSNPFAEYSFIYKNKYDKYDATETIRLIQEGNKSIRIVFYNIISDGFME